MRRDGSSECGSLLDRLRLGGRHQDGLRLLVDRGRRRRHVLKSERKKLRGSQATESSRALSKNWLQQVVHDVVWTTGTDATAALVTVAAQLGHMQHHCELSQSAQHGTQGRENPGSHVPHQLRRQHKRMTLVTDVASCKILTNIQQEVTFAILSKLNSFRWFFL